MLSSLNRFFSRLTDNADLGKLILRVTVAGLMLFHGVAKLDHGIAGIEGMLDRAGFPTFIAGGVYIGEIIAPILIILGIFTRFAAFILSVTIIVAVMLVKSYSKFLILTKVGASGLEVELFYVLGGFAVMFLGAGRYSIMRNESLR